MFPCPDLSTPPPPPPPEQCGYDHAPVTRGRMRAQFPLPHGPPPEQWLGGAGGLALGTAHWPHRSLALRTESNQNHFSFASAEPEAGHVW